MLSGTGNIYLQFLQGPSCAPDHLRSPQLIAQNRQKPALKVAHRTKQILREGCLISVYPAFGQGVLDRGITTQQRGACANAESFVRKTLKQRLKLLSRGLGSDAL